MNADEKRVQALLGPYGLDAQEFSKQERRIGKTPDFRVLRDGHLAFFCEVKSIDRDKWLEKRRKSAPPDTAMVGGSRQDPIFNRLTADVHTAVQQFDAVNETCEFPNVLVLVNHDRMCGYLDLIAVLTGNFVADDDTLHPIYRRFAEGRIKGEKRRIHLFVWLDDFKADQWLFDGGQDGHHAILCDLFGVDPKSLNKTESE